MRVSFNVRGVPKPQPRPRAFARKMGDGRAVARVFDAGTAEGWKSAVVAAGAPHRPASPIEGPIDLRIHFVMPRPKRLMRKKDPDGPLPCPTKPDLDNLVKAVKDAMTVDGWWRDDAQVVSHRCAKSYAEKGGATGAWIMVETVNGEGTVEP